MRRLIILLFFLVVSVWLGLLVVKHPGYLMLVFQNWMVQMPLWFALIGLVLGLMLFYFVITAIDSIHFLWFRFKNWLKYRGEHKSYSKTQHGLAMLIEARWRKAENLLLAGVSQSFEPLMNYLGAAKAAQAQGAYDRRNLYIKKAYETVPNATLAIGLTEAELEMEHHEYAAAKETLLRLRAKSSRHPRVLTLLEKIYVHYKDWTALLGLLPAMKKAKVLNREQYANAEKNTYCEILNNTYGKTLIQLQALWNDMPRAVRKHPDVACAYVKQLLRYSDTNEAEGLIRKTLRSHWQPELARIYGTLPFININRQLVIAGAWLKQYGQKPELLLTLGRLCMRIQLWGKAKDYLEKCLSLGANPEASQTYSELLKHLENSYGFARNS